MFERLLDKQNQPTPQEFYAHCGEREALLKSLNSYLTEELGCAFTMRFPYGNSYGWGLKYAKKSTHVCDVFAEKDAFTVMLRCSNAQFERVYGDLSCDGKTYADNKYPCSDGGWVHYRVLTTEHLEDVKKLLTAKLEKKNGNS